MISDISDVNDVGDISDIILVESLLVKEGNHVYTSFTAGNRSVAATVC